MTQPIVSIDKTGQPIDITQTSGFDLFFWYNKDNNIDTKVQNAVAKITVQGTGLQINKTRLEDIYFEDVSQSALLSCDVSSAGKGAVISPDLIQNNSLMYGLQSAKKNLKDELGTSSADLEAGQFGCLRVGFEIVGGAVPGQKVKIIYDSDAKNSPSIVENKKPAVIEMEFLYAGGSGSSNTLPTTSSSSQSSQQATQANRETIFNSSITQGLGFFVAFVLIITFAVWFFGRKKEK